MSFTAEEIKALWRRRRSGGFVAPVGFSTAELTVESLPGGTLIVPNGTGGDTDTTIRELGNMIDEGVDGPQRYKIVYSGHTGAYTGTNVYAHYAYSADGVTWTKGGRIIGTTRALEDSYLVKHDGVYYLFAEDKGDVPFRNIRLYTSTDFATWTDRGDVLDIGTTGTWEAQDVSSPAVIVVNDTFYLFYEGRSATQSGAIGLATAPVSLTPTFTKNPGNPIIVSSNYIPSDINWADQIVSDDIIRSSDGTYVMLYHGRFLSTGSWKTGVLTSTDLVNWTPVPDDLAYVAHGRVDVETSFAPIGDDLFFISASDRGDGIRLAQEGPAHILTANFTGANGSTSFTDISDWGSALVANGGAQIQGDALELDGAGDFVSSVARDLWELHDYEFTLELFGVRFDSDTGVRSLLSQFGASGTWSWRADFRGDLSPKRLRMLGYTSGNTGSFLTDATWTPVIGQEYDICFERRGTTCRIYVDGTMLASGSLPSAFFKSTQPLRIGANGLAGSEAFLDGAIRAVRITKGRGLYASDAGYVVPSLPLA